MVGALVVAGVAMVGMSSRVALAQTTVSSTGGAELSYSQPNGDRADAAHANGATASEQRTLPASVRGYRLVSGPVLDTASSAVRYTYARGPDKIDVWLAPYASDERLRSEDDTVSVVQNDYAVMYDTLFTLAQRNDATLRVYFDHEDDLHVNGHTYRGWVSQWTWVARDGHRIGCDPSFLTRGTIGVGWSCYQQTYATPQGLVRVCARLNPTESVGGGDLFPFSNELIAEMTKS